ncbi:uncharacterized protein LOC110869838 [Helianthus annuus]|uniref:uncharacterized protein LOC110869838 n=1 Tax=Helianthus annuus TaxID=4232 RepID=UPI000B907F0F|nr:uncharacterized protein LOC110869838 [Helianthus annuus]
MGKLAPPNPSDEQYEQWEQDDLVVFSWLIQNIEPGLAGNLTEFPTAKALWDALVVTYSSGKDKLQTFDLHVKANELKQNGSALEDFWIKLQGIWGEIDRRDPNPMTCSVDIATYNNIRKFHPVKREILRRDPLPSAEQAYAAVRNEMAYQGICGTISETSQSGVTAGLIAGRTTEIDGHGLITKGQRRSGFTGKSSSRIDKSKLKCSHCGMNKHTKDQCFRIAGFPDCWSDNHKTKNPNQEGKVVIAIGNNKATINDNDEKDGGSNVSKEIIRVQSEDASETEDQDGYTWH